MVAPTTTLSINMRQVEKHVIKEGRKLPTTERSTVSVGALKPRVYPTSVLNHYDFWVILPTNTQPVCSSKVNS